VHGKVLVGSRNSRVVYGLALRFAPRRATMTVKFIRAAAFIAATCVLMLGAQDDTLKLKVDVPVVSLDVIVQDANNHPLTTLHQPDFQIFEDGVPQEITYFASAETPRSTLLLFDVTGVMESQGPFMVKAMNVFLANVRQRDRVAVAAFGPDFEMLMNFRAVQGGKPMNVKLPPTRINSNVYDALSEAGRRIKDEKGRKAVIAMTDGRDTYMFNEVKRLGYVPTIQQDTDFQGRLKGLRKRGVPIYIAALDT